MNMSGIIKIVRATPAIIASCLVAATVRADPKLRFEVTEIVSAESIYPAAINNHGVVVGGIANGARLQPFIYESGIVEMLPFEDAVVTDINDAGDFTISANSAGYVVRAGLVTALQSSPDAPFYPRRLNNHGIVVGTVVQTYLHSYAASWSNGVVRHLSPISGHSASDINDSGVAIGSMLENPYSLTATIFRDGQAIPLGTVPGSPSSDAEAVNSRGEILVRGYSSEGVRTFLFRAGTMLDIGTVPGATAIHGQALNNSGQIVGYSWNVERRERAFLYIDGQIHDLNELVKPNRGWTLWTATAINDKGQIAAVGQINGGPQTAFLLTPKKQPKPAHFKPPHGVFPLPQ